ncbi:hypothetical protein evm_006239 [Chilo suppressalis]|nr:hypothetical protein evm_006239 [Chilo suppressalis]
MKDKKQFAYASINNSKSLVLNSRKESWKISTLSLRLLDNERALHIDQGKHLIPWMGDETLKIDRYDARGALHDLSSLEAPSGGYDWRVELTRAELDVEQLCDEERYRALHTDEDEEEMYKEEELKRLHAAGYGQVGFNYDAPKEQESAPLAEVEEPFLPTAAYKALFPEGMILPESLKQNAIIEKTAKFIASQGTQMEILIKAKQGDNPQFQFLNKDSNLNAYYSTLTGLVKAEKWPEKKVEVVEEKPPDNEEYLHPSLASTVIESAPSIPSIHYRPSADCDYTMLVSKMRGTPTLDEVYAPELAPGEEPPPGTEPLPPRVAVPVPVTQPAPDIARAPVMYHRPPPAVTEQSLTAQYHQYAAYYNQNPAQTPSVVQPITQPVVQPVAPAVNDPPRTSTGLSLMKNYNTDSDTDASDSDDASSPETPTILDPPEDVQVVIDKMAAYVARNGDEFADIVRAKNDPRFTFLEPANVYHPYYKKLMQQKRGIDVNGTAKQGKNKSSAAPVSFSIKKLKEPDPILPKPALPYESSSDDESDKQEKAEETKETPKPVVPQTFPAVEVPPVVVYKIENPTPEPITPTVEIVKPIPKPEPEIKEIPKAVTPELKAAPVVEEYTKPQAVAAAEKKRVPESPVKEKRRYKERKKEYRSKSEVSESHRSEKRSADREKRREKEAERAKKRRSDSKAKVEDEIISLVDNPEDLIDLTGDQSDSKGEVDSELDRSKQQERRRRAAEFLKKVGVDPTAATLPATSLASAMVDTLESLRKKKEEEEEKRRKREKRRHRHRYEYENGSERSHRKSKRRRRSSEEESDYDGKRRRRKKDKKHSSKSKKRRRRDTEVGEEEVDQPLNIDLTSTLKELRNSSPTKELVQDIDEGTQQSLGRRDSTDDAEGKSKDKKKKKEDREYSEGEWSSDSEQDSASSASRMEE